MRKFVLVAIILALLLFPVLPFASVAEAQGGIQLVPAFLLISGAYFGTQIAYYVPHLVSNFQPYISNTIAGANICSRLGLLGCRNPEDLIDEVHIIPINNPDTSQRILDELREQAFEQLLDILQQLMSSWWRRWWTRVTIGVDARPMANPFEPQFMYRTYQLGDCFSRWDFYPPGNWTINAWMLDLNTDGRTDIVLSSNVQVVCLR